MAGRGVTDYNIGGKKLITVFCGERANVMCCASVNDGRWKTDDDPLRVETCSAFFVFILIYIFKCWCVGWSCLLPLDSPPQDACLQDIVYTMHIFPCLLEVTAKPLTHDKDGISLS
jgi:hypothetical protein